MDFTLKEQMWCLLWSLVLGVFLGVVYDLIRFFRISLCRGRVSVFLLDLMFMLFCAFSCVFFSMGFSRGSTRYFTLIGMAAGFFIYFFTAGRIIRFLFEFVFKKVRRLLGFIYNYFSKTSKRVLKLAGRILYNITGYIGCFLVSKILRKDRGDGHRGRKERKKVFNSL